MEKKRTAEDIRRALELDAKKRDKRIAYNPEEYKEWSESEK